MSVYWPCLGGYSLPRLFIVFRVLWRVTRRCLALTLGLWALTRDHENRRRD